MFSILFVFATISLNVSSETTILEENRIKGRNRFVGKETFVIRTLCIDGYKFVTYGNSFVQFYQNQDGLPMPVKCHLWRSDLLELQPARTVIIYRIFSNAQLIFNTNSNAFVRQTITKNFYLSIQVRTLFYKYSPLVFPTKYLPCKNPSTSWGA